MKKLMAVLLSAFCAFGALSMTGCGNGKDDPKTDEPAAGADAGKTDDGDAKKDDGDAKKDDGDAKKE